MDSKWEKSLISQYYKLALCQMEREFTKERIGITKKTIMKKQAKDLTCDWVVVEKNKKNKKRFTHEKTSSMPMCKQHHHQTGV